MITKTRATVEDLYHVSENGKAELVNGELVLMPATGAMPNYAGGEIFHSLRSYTRLTKGVHVTADNAGFLVNLPNRQSFSPDAAYYVGPNPGMKFFRERLSSPPKCAARMTTALQWSVPSRKRLPTTSWRAPKSSGTWTCSAPTW